MRKSLTSLGMVVMLAIVLTSCTQEAETLIVDTSLPQGNFSVEKSGTFVEQNATGTAGSVQIGSDEEGVQFLKLGTDFTTGLATGTVTVYFSTSMDYVADPGLGNPDLRLLGVIQKTGETYFKIDPILEDEFTHVILWCATANIPFGYAELN